MAKIRDDQPLVPSVLDRLIDDEPDTNREPPKSRTQVLRELRVSVRRDLENLLNTRQRVVSPPAGLSELQKSLVNYGIPDFKDLTMTSTRGREKLRALIENVIRTYEPRFKTVRVELIENSEPLDRTVRFRVDALLYAEPAPEPVVFDSALEPTTGSVEVSTTGR